MGKSNSEIKTKTYGLILSDNSERIYYPESLMPPDDRFFACELALRGDYIEILYSYYRKGDSTEIVTGGTYGKTE